MIYESKNSTFEAVQWLGNNLSEVEEFCSFNGSSQAWPINDNPFLLACKRGMFSYEDAHVGDYIIRRFYKVDGQDNMSLKVVKGELFNLFFEPSKEFAV